MENNDLIDPFFSVYNTQTNSMIWIGKSSTDRNSFNDMYIYTYLIKLAVGHLKHSNNHIS